VSVETAALPTNQRESREHTMKKLTVIAVASMLAAFNAIAAPSISGATVEQAAAYGGNYVITINASDFAALTSTNVDFAFTNTFTAPVSVRFAGYKLLGGGFDSITDTNVYSLTMSIGDGNSSTKWVTTAQIAADSTPTIYGAFGSDYTAAITGQATNVTGIAVTSPILNAQTSNVKVITTFSQTGPCAPSSLNRGAVQIFLRVIGKTY